MTSLKAVLGGLPLNSAEYKTGESQPFLEAFSAFRHVTRIAIGVLLAALKLCLFFNLSTSAVAEVAIIKKNGAQVKHGLELYVSFIVKIYVTEEGTVQSTLPSCQDMGR